MGSRRLLGPQRDRPVRSQAARRSSSGLSSSGFGYLTPSYFGFSRAIDRERLLIMPGAEPQTSLVKFSHVESALPDLSRNPRAVAERARRLGRLRITHRDTQDFYLTAADREEERDENLMTAARVFAALARSESGERAVASALAEVFPWVRHLATAERRDFAEELIAALSDAAELAIDRTAHEVIAGWRATARIKADESLYKQALAPTQGDFGPVQALG